MTTAVTMGAVKLPILKCLSRYAGPVGMETIRAEVFAEVFGSMPTDPEDLKKANQALANAGFALRQNGTITSAKREWAATQLGRDVAEGRAEMPKTPVATTPSTGDTTTGDTTPGDPAPTPPAPVVPPAVSVATALDVPTTTPEATTPAPTKPVEVPPTDLDTLATNLLVNPPTTKRLPVWVEPAATEPWTKDPELRALVAYNTPCYGEWRPTDEQCQRCQLAFYCRNAQAAALGLLADRMRVEQMSREALALHGTMASAMSPKEGRTPAALVTSVAITAASDGFCPRTERPYKKGDKVYYIPSVGIVLKVD